MSPETPRIEDGIYWGYQVRNATSFRKVIYGKLPSQRPTPLYSSLNESSIPSFKETSFKETYDLKIAIPNTNKMSFDHLKGKLSRAK